MPGFEGCVTHLFPKLLSVSVTDCLAPSCFISSENSLFFLSHFYSNQFGLIFLSFFF